MHHFFRVMSQLTLLVWILITLWTLWLMIAIRDSAPREEMESGEYVGYLLTQAVPTYMWLSCFGLLISAALFHIAAETTLLRRATEAAK